VESSHDETKGQEVGKNSITTKTKRQARHGRKIKKKMEKKWMTSGRKTEKKRGGLTREKVRKRNLGGRKKKKWGGKVKYGKVRGK